MSNYSKKSNKGTSRRRGRKKESPEFDKSAQYKVRDREESKHNDASWYIKGAQLVQDAGRLAYAQPVGCDVDLDSDFVINNASGRNGHMRVPGVMELRYVPMIGTVKENSDPANISMRNIYSWIRHVNSGHVNYDDPDLMLYLLAMDSIYQLYAHMCRVYGCVRLYSQTNRHLPFTLFKALGVDYDDIQAHLADFRAYINTFAVRIGSFAVPNTMDYFTRHLWMASGIYMDSMTTKAQAYVFRPGILGRYEETDGAGYLAYDTTMSAYTMGYEDFVELGNRLLNSIVASEDVGIMSGDILKAYTQDQLIKVLTIADDFLVIPAYSEEVLRQIQNATVFDGSIAFNTDRYIYQDVGSNTLRCGVELYTHNTQITGRRFMLSNVESPTPEEVMVDSRLSVLGNITARQPGSNAEPPAHKVEVTSCGSEIIYYGAVHNISESGNSFEVTPFETYGCCGDLGNWTNRTIWDAMEIMANMSMFKYHPFMYLAIANGSTVDDDPTYLFTVGDVDNYTVVDDIELSKLHTAALLSLFDVPQIAR